MTGPTPDGVTPQSVTPPLRQSSADPVLDNTLALGQFVERTQRCGIAWGLFFDPAKVIPENRYELRIFDGPARAIYRGATATHAASKAQAALDEHRIGWVFASYCPHCHTGGPGEDYCGGCGEAI